MIEKPERNMKWILIISLILFFWSAYIALMSQTTYAFRPDVWYYLRNVNVLSFILTLLSATLHTAGIERTDKIAIGLFIVSMSLFFISNLSWIWSGY